MRLTPDFVRHQVTLLEGYYGFWFTQCARHLDYFRGVYPNVKVPAHLHKVLPPVARRVVEGLAQQIPVSQRRVHCPPARNPQGRETAETQKRSSKREAAHRAAFLLDDFLALRKMRRPPSAGALVEGLLFGLSAEVVLPEDLALQPPPKRRAGETQREFERRRRAWETLRQGQHQLPAYLPGILNLLIDPDLRFFLWRFRMSRHRAEELLDRWGFSLPSALARQTTVDWMEAYSDETRLVFIGPSYDASLVKELPGYGFLPLSMFSPVRGEPALYTANPAVALSGPQHMFNGILAGLETVLDDIARRESEISNHIAEQVYPKRFTQGNLPADFKLDLDPSTSFHVDDPGFKISLVPSGSLPPEAWKSVEHNKQYVDELSQISALQGYRQASSGYQEAILTGLATGVLRPYVVALDQLESEVAMLRNRYVLMADYFLDGVVFDAGDDWAELKPDDIDRVDVQVKHEARLPQQRQTEAQFWRDAFQVGAISRRRLQEEGYGIEDTEAEDAQRTAEQWMDSQEVRAAMTRRLAAEYDPALLGEIEQIQAEGTEQVATAIRRQQGPALGPPAGPAPPSAETPENEIQRLIEQAERFSRGRLPTGGRV